MNYLLRDQCAYIGIKFEDRKERKKMQYTYISCKILKVRWGIKDIKTVLCQTEMISGF